jgi:hypothetical protein
LRPTRRLYPAASTSDIIVGIPEFVRGFAGKKEDLIADRRRRAKSSTATQKIEKGKRHETS